MFDKKHPIILEAPHRLIRLLLEHLHNQECPQGVACLRALVQQPFATNRALRIIVSRCAVCRKRRAENLTPIIVDLPREKIQRTSVSKHWR